MDSETQNWREQAEHWHEECLRLRKMLEGKQQVTIAPPSNPKTTTEYSPESFVNNQEFVTDCARYSEGLLSKADVKRKWHFTDDTIWTTLAKDEGLIEAIEAEKIRRVRNGAAKREKAQKHIIRGPDALAAIMDNSAANARHVVDAIKTLDALAGGSNETTPTADKFVIHIDLTGDAKLKGIEPNPNDIINLEVTLPQKTITDEAEDNWKR